MLYPQNEVGGASQRKRVGGRGWLQRRFLPYLRDCLDGARDKRQGMKLLPKPRVYLSHKRRFLLLTPIEQDNMERKQMDENILPICG